MDLYLFNFVNGFADKWAWLDLLEIFFAKYSEFFLLFALVIFLWKRHSKKLIIELFFAGTLSRAIIVEIIRFLWQRPRPFDVLDAVVLLPLKTEPSFPSGHAAFYFALATIVYFYNKKLGYCFFGISCLMILARIFVGYHWPSDILTGVVIGVFSGFLIYKISEKYFSKST